MAELTGIKKLEKGRAEFAYRCAKEGIEIKEYRSYARKIPTMILTNGLGQTLAFIRSKGKKEEAYKRLYEQITNYLKSENTTRIRMPDSENDLMRWVVSQDSLQYRYITQEVIAFLNWLKRFAEGMPVKEEKSD